MHTSNYRKTLLENKVNCSSIYIELLFEKFTTHPFNRITWKNTKIYLPYSMEFEIFLLSSRYYYVETLITRFSFPLVN